MPDPDAKFIAAANYVVTNAPEYTPFDPNDYLVKYNELRT
jgi:hypothetical protein